MISYSISQLLSAYTQNNQSSACFKFPYIYFYFIYYFHLFIFFLLQFSRLTNYFYRLTLTHFARFATLSFTFAGLFFIYYFLNNKPPSSVDHHEVTTSVCSHQYTRLQWVFEASFEAHSQLSSGNQHLV
jgi:hypothetical protein